MYELYLERAAERDLKRLSADDFKRVISVIKKLGGEPRPAGCRKIVDSANDYRLRVGDLRVVYEIDDDARVVRIMRVRHRDVAYR